MKRMRKTFLRPSLCVHFWGKQETVFNIKNIELNGKSSFHRKTASEFYEIPENSCRLLPFFLETAHSNKKINSNKILCTFERVKNRKTRNLC